MYKRTLAQESDGRQPAVVRETRLQRGTVSLGAMTVVIKSGGREPAVGVGNALATALPQSRGRLPALCSRRPVQSR
jgi:hypothetical protein